MTAQDEARPRRRWLPLLPFILFMVLAGIFLVQLLSGKDSSVVPSALIGQEAPQTPLPALEGMNLPGFDPAAFAGKVTLVNVWASWCAPCRVEHPVLMQLAKDGRVEIAGLNYKDKPENARRFLNELGNPYSMIGTDDAGRAAIEWGVYGVPETFLVGKDGRIAYKHVGPFTPEIMTRQILPEIEKALAAEVGS
ncbi:DsbE family thiol:disulfide interchange protein [Aquamicrobium zhengzhouense]|uniref:DsbE family thiol:disulfide interchange protein n=1 Tax=Aquamicrobium zhengzhouense TaxID=2781738 RepID=A0ABS0SF18_9HYPH|nr:DsbE family thiol:disulfide interchange protein [Aquamicrobium zhengzhouense]MBI1621890.1 DsbE family thiol:disulfide interchange protein [Aquamicrobium zhengzhouense]